MVKWAKQGLGAGVRLMMICVEAGEEGYQTARWFGRQFRTPATVVNCYIDDESEVVKKLNIIMGLPVMTDP